MLRLSLCQRRPVDEYEKTLGIVFKAIQNAGVTTLSATLREFIAHIDPRDVTLHDMALVIPDVSSVRFKPHGDWRSLTVHSKITRNVFCDDDIEQFLADSPFEQCTAVGAMQPYLFEHLYGHPKTQSLLKRMFAETHLWDFVVFTIFNYVNGDLWVFLVHHATEYGIDMGHATNYVCTTLLPKFMGRKTCLQFVFKHFQVPGDVVRSMYQQSIHNVNIPAAMFFKARMQ
jgi:hypothetical protein